MLRLLSCVVLLVVAWKVAARLRTSGNQVTEKTLDRIRAEHAQDEMEREQVEMPRGRRILVDGPPPTKALSRAWNER